MFPDKSRRSAVFDKAIKPNLLVYRYRKSINFSISNHPHNQYTFCARRENTERSPGCGETPAKAGDYKVLVIIKTVDAVRIKQ